MPRFFTTSNFEIISDRKEILKLLFSDFFNPNKIILEEYPGFEPKSYQGNLKITNYSANEISMEVLSNNSTLIYFSDNYSKAFKVFIDGVEGKILRANYTFRAIALPKGNHTVKIRYQTESFKIGVAISLVSFILLIGLFFFLRPKVGGKKYHR